MPAVADSSVIIHLAAIGRLDLLRQFYGSLQIPPAVWDEVVVQGQRRPGSQELTAAVADRWVTLAKPSSSVPLPAGGATLHLGESEAIRLALSPAGSPLLMDEAAGRAVAASLGIAVMGTIGVLVAAKHSGLIPELKPVLEQLRNPGGFRLSAAVFQHALTLVGEQP